MEQLTDRSLFRVYREAKQLNKKGEVTEDFIRLIEKEISKRGLPLNEQ
ncbi:sporulation histidine kinase inhibitor Sda [Niallia sp. XMNu-256]